jgi:hypothetical protein
MDSIVEAVSGYISSYNWDNPLTFGIVIVAALAVFGKWRFILAAVATWMFAVLARDLIVMNILTRHEVITVPEAIYFAGGFIILLMLFFAFVRFMLTP